jgi:phosphatidylcholine synthase
MTDPSPLPHDLRHTPLRKGLAWGVHLFTALGAVLGTLALIAITRGEFRLAAILMVITFTIDAVDGTFARAVGVSQLLPRIDGRRLDDMIDFLNFVIVPMVFMVAGGLLETPGWVALAVLASCYGFSQTDAKTEDDFFLGFPSYWNILALYLWILDIAPGAGTLWLVALSVAVFVPLRYVYPTKLEVLRFPTNLGGFVWTAALGVAAFLPDGAPRDAVAWISLVYPAYYIALSAWLGRWFRGWPHRRRP